MPTELVWFGRLEHCQLLLTGVKPHLKTSGTPAYQQLGDHRERICGNTCRNANLCHPCSPFLGVTLETFVIDWLRCMDLGMAADFAGNLLFHVLPCFPGRDIKQQCKVLHRHLQSLVQGQPRLVQQAHQFDSLDDQEKRNAKGQYTSQSSGLVLGEMRSLVPMASATCSVHFGQQQTFGKHDAGCYPAFGLHVSTLESSSVFTLWKWPLTVGSFCSCMWNWKRILLKDSGNSSRNSTWHRNCVSMIW